MIGHNVTRAHVRRERATRRLRRPDTSSGLTVFALVVAFGRSPRSASIVTQQQTRPNVWIQSTRLKKWSRLGGECVIIGARVHQEASSCNLSLCSILERSIAALAAKDPDVMVTCGSRGTVTSCLSAAAQDDAAQAVIDELSWSKELPVGSNER